MLCIFIAFSYDCYITIGTSISVSPYDNVLLFRNNCRVKKVYIQSLAKDKQTSFPQAEKESTKCMKASLPQAEKESTKLKNKKVSVLL